MDKVNTNRIFEKNFKKLFRLIDEEFDTNFTDELNALIKKEQEEQEKQEEHNKRETELKLKEYYL